MNQAQINALKRTTNALQSRHIDGNLAFRIEQAGNGEFMLMASNVDYDLRWYERVEDFFAFIGPRGGVRKYSGSLSI